ncbi:MAG: nucleotidyltransferase domain-containing protein [Candidatus Riflebacteria bacterium]|nr:nucleotidyltransferase domain-containing protein [Candidatus Riflebacteria bacterium]
MRVSEALFAPARRRLLALFFTNPERRYHVREVIRQVGLGSGSVQNEVGRLLAAGLLEVSREGRQVYYQVNRTSPVFPELRGLILKTEGIQQVIESALRPLADRITVAFIYGSFARGTETHSSDVDVLIVGDLSLDDVAAALGPVHDVLDRDINPSLLSNVLFRKRRRADDSFLRRVLEGGKIFLLGDQDVLERLG